MAHLRMTAVVCGLLLACPLAGQWIPADQSSDPLGPAQNFAPASGPWPQPDALIPGLQLERVVLFQSYSSRALPPDIVVPPSLGKLGGDIESGASATFAWRRQGRRSDVELIYAPSFVARRRHPEWNHGSHFFSLNAGRTVRKDRWSVALRSRASLNENEDFFYDPPVLGTVSNPPATFEELAEQAASGQLASDEVASVLTGAPVVRSPERFEQDFSQVLSTGIGATATYDRTPRMAMRLGVTASRYQFVSGRGRNASVAGRFFLPATTTALARAAIDYRISPRTALAAELTASRAFTPQSTLRGAVYSTQTVTLERRIGRRWSTQLRGGSGTVHGRAGAAAQAAAWQTWVAGVGVGYRGREHSFRLVADRTVGDSFGFAARSSVTARGSWQWQLPGRPWALRGSIAHSQSELIGVRNYSGWVARMALVRQLSPRTSAVTSYSRVSYSSAFRGAFGDMNRSQLQVSLTWTPRPRQR